MRAVALAVLVSFGAHAADGGWPDAAQPGSGPADVVSLVPVHAIVRQLDGGVELVDSLACMAPDTAQAIDVGLRTAEADRDTYRTVALVAVPVGVAAVVTAVVLGVAMAGKK